MNLTRFDLFDTKILHIQIVNVGGSGSFSFLIFCDTDKVSFIECDVLSYITHNVRLTVVLEHIDLCTVSLCLLN